MKSAVYLIVLFSLLSFSLFAQSKKKIKENKIKSITIWSTKIVENADKNAPYKLRFELYDNKGNLIEETDYKQDGTIKEQHKYKYNPEDDIIEEIITADSGKYQKLVIEYDSYGNKTELNAYNKDNTLKEREVSSYDKNDLKTKRITYNAQNKIISTRTNQYEYYK